MALSNFANLIGKRVMGIDASTHTIAYAIFEDKKIVEYGELNFDGGTVYERIHNAKRVVRALKKRFEVDFIAIEAAVMVRSAQTGLKMAYIFGAIMGELLDNGATVVEVHPLKWQGYIGNPNFTKAQKAGVKAMHPDKSDTWIKNEIRNMRKRKTMDFMDKLGVHTDSDNVADASGIAWYAVNELTR
jgi:Holliday junction resolvasome RuvABC endonuclease subunit